MNKKNYKAIYSNPIGEIYELLIDLAFRECNKFILVERKSIPKSENVQNVLNRLKAYLIETREEYEWLGTYLLSGDPATVYYYNTNDNAKKIIKEVSNSLYDWIHPNLPEDLGFYKNNEPWLINTAHEHESCIVISGREENDKVSYTGLDYDYKNSF